jgi:ketosteroid isomerase-like protein
MNGWPVASVYGLTEVRVGTMQIDDRLVIEAMCASWAVGDLDGLMQGFIGDVQFSVGGLGGAVSFLRSGQGKAILRGRLGLLLSEIEIVRFQPMQIVREDGAWLHTRVHYHYVHRRSGLDIDGTMRNNCCMRGGRIVRYQVVHDTARMAAFVELARRSIAET